MVNSLRFRYRTNDQRTEDAYVDGVKSVSLRNTDKCITSKDMLGHEEFKKNFENEDFEKDSFIIEYVRVLKSLKNEKLKCSRNEGFTTLIPRIREFKK